MFQDRSIPLYNLPYAFAYTNLVNVGDAAAKLKFAVKFFNDVTWLLVKLDTRLRPPTLLKRNYK